MHVVVGVCVRACYYITAAIGVAATATIVATAAASHAPPLIYLQSTCPSSLSPQLIQNWTEIGPSAVKSTSIET